MDAVRHSPASLEALVLDAREVEMLTDPPVTAQMLIAYERLAAEFAH